MASKYRYSGSLVDQLPPADRDTLVAVLTPYFDLLWDAVMDPWEDFRRRRCEGDKRFTDLTEDEAGVWLTTQANHRVRGLFTNKDHFRLMEEHRKPLIIVKEQVVVVVKKLTFRLDPKTLKRVLTRSNYPTPRNTDFWDQRRNAGPEFPRVILGYELLREVTDITLRIAYPRTRGKGVEWYVEIPPPAAKPSIFVPVAPNDDSGHEGKGFTVTAADDANQNTPKQGTDGP